MTVALGATATVNSSLQVGGLTETVQVVAETPLIDLGASTRQRSIPAEQLDVIPKGRSFQSVATALPSVNTGELEGGFQVNGASAGENNFTVDGVPVVSLINGSQRQDAVFEYLQEVQVRTSVCEAEYGGALGERDQRRHQVRRQHLQGLASTSTTRPTGSRRTTAFVKRLQIDPATQNSASSVQDNAQTYTRNEFGGSIGGPIVRDRMFFFGAVSPRVYKRDPGVYHRRLVKWYRSRANARRAAISARRSFVPTNRLQFNLSGLWTPTAQTGVTIVTLRDGPRANQTTVVEGQPRVPPNPRLGDSAVEHGVHGGLHRHQLHARVGPRRLHEGQLLRHGRQQVADVRVRHLGRRDRPACRRSTTQPAGFNNLPRMQINDHDITNAQLRRPVGEPDAGAAGVHQFKGGFGYSRATNDVDLAYPNSGYVTVFWGQTYISDVPGVGAGTGTYGYYTIDDIGTKGATGANILSLYAQDSWQIGSRLTLNLGIRTESEDIPSFRPDISPVGIHFGWGEKRPGQAMPARPCSRRGASFSVQPKWMPTGEMSGRNEGMSSLSVRMPRFSVSRDPICQLSCAYRLRMLAPVCALRADVVDRVVAVGAGARADARDVAVYI